MATRFSKQRIALTADEWTPLTAPIAADYVVWRCDTSAITVRTDKNDASTEDTVVAGAQDGVQSSNVSRMLGGARFPAGRIVAWLKSVEPSATAQVTWLL